MESDARSLSLRTAEQQQQTVNVRAGMVNEGLAMTHVIYGAIHPKMQYVQKGKKIDITFRKRIS